MAICVWAGVGNVRFPNAGLCAPVLSARYRYGITGFILILQCGVAETGRKEIPGRCRKDIYKRRSIVAGILKGKKRGRGTFLP